MTKGNSGTRCSETVYFTTWSINLRLACHVPVWPWLVVCFDLTGRKSIKITWKSDTQSPGFAIYLMSKLKNKNNLQFGVLHSFLMRPTYLINWNQTWCCKVLSVNKVEVEVRILRFIRAFFPTKSSKQPLRLHLLLSANIRYASLQPRRRIEESHEF